MQANVGIVDIADKQMRTDPSISTTTAATKEALFSFFMSIKEKDSKFDT